VLEKSPAQTIIQASAAESASILLSWRVRKQRSRKGLTGDMTCLAENVHPGYMLDDPHAPPRCGMSTPPFNALETSATCQAYSNCNSRTITKNLDSLSTGQSFSLDHLIFHNNLGATIYDKVKYLRSLTALHAAIHGCGSMITLHAPRGHTRRKACRARHWMRNYDVYEAHVAPIYLETGEKVSEVT
jgi:hypothetical protein